MLLEEVLTEISQPIPNHTQLLIIQLPIIHPSTYSFWTLKPVYTEAFKQVSGSMW